MLKTGFSHGVAIVPNAPKQRYTDPDTGAHFDFDDMCERLEKLMKKRFLEEMAGERKSLNKDFLNTQAARGRNLFKDDGPEEVLEESEIP